ELALPAQVDDAAMVGGPDLGDVALVRVHALEHEVEARAEAMAAPAAVADLRDAGKLLLDGGGVEEGGVAGIEGQLQLLEVLQPLREAAGVAALRLGQGLEPLRDLREALFARGPGHARIHLRVLVGLALDGG